MSTPLTSGDVATRLGIHPSRVRRMAVHYGIGEKIGRDWLFSEKDINRFKQHSTGKAGRPPLKQPIEDEADTDRG